MNSFPKSDVLAACAKYGPLLHVPAGIDGERVMLAIASNESSLGYNCGPRHEDAYDTGGILWHSSPAQQALVREYGPLGASSFGPWQMMLINCPGCSPADLIHDLDLCAEKFVHHFNGYVMHYAPSSIEQIGQIWNAGHKMANPGPGVVRYCADIQEAYDKAVSA